ncbi:ABC transporter ATP-binding protein [uncultured Desulfovibrio sp.]|uniref:ABC transporter ATP-binding protein n=1 Tax=uncultured Desulfovibrio sp. TaxID=167968 RepID=UPI0003AA98CC|nr:ABC transporter ATP-binding protein [uncultured Desulfovibrio sp.]
MSNAIEVRGLTKKFGDVAVVKSLTLDVPEGQIVGFLGPNGSGKTTTLRMMCGLLTPDAGSGSCIGYDILTQADQIKLQVGYMPQKFSLYEDMTLAENLAFTARIYGLADVRGETAAVLRKLGLWKQRNKLAGSLSGGWKQRLALASCVMHKPRLLLLDEPTAGVDPSARREFWEEIHMLAAEGITVLVSTHYMDEAERCHSIAYISHGEMLACGTSRELIDLFPLAMYSASLKPGLTPSTLTRIAKSIEAQPNVDVVIPFGNDLHVGGSDANLLDEAISPWRNDPALIWSETQASLEDIFILLMNRTLKQPKNSTDA